MEQCGIKNTEAHSFSIMKVSVDGLGVFHTVYFSALVSYFSTLLKR